MKRLLLLGGLLFPGWCFALPVFASSPSPADMRSLFFSDDELGRIESENSKAEPEAPSRDPKSISLGALLYYAPGRWAVWLQGEKWTPESRRADIKILEVKPGSARLLFTPKDNAVAQEITLSPYQTYHFSSRQITEGEP
jgi:hypothetical protein